MNIYTERYINTYSDILEKLDAKVNWESIKIYGLISPHIPMCGPLYGQKLPKVAIVGEETRGWGDLEEFISNIRSNARKVIEDSDWVFKEHEFTKWTNNFGKTFWDTAFKILAKIHGEENWKNLKNKNRADILDSFVWANVNSIEGFNISAKHKGAEYESWQHIKNVSTEILDKYQIIENIFTPDITVIMNWDIPSNYLNIDWKSLESHLSIGHTKKGSEIYRMAHPTWLNTHHEYNSVLNRLFKEIDANPHRTANRNR